ncbi:hypothetical protein GCM10010413_10260 [Promicromonospora sukumoe]|uniref:Asp23/Gls24 family envelope stress response protein n=1 Tax=Promicromonospora sukumoe TaxID=88382 RepID=A0A7W3J5S5_9MICO|nr:hypothetical protein [Promicromonospora sukumoe]MBA8806689.1 hypothetical protein [Promicromonospora sukumoe]
MTAVEPVGGAVPGTLRISARAVEKLAACLAHEAAYVPLGQVSVRLADAGGALTVAVTLPVTVGGGVTGSIEERSSALRRHVITGMRDLGGRTVGSVDVRYAGVRRISGRRVR